MLKLDSLGTVAVKSLDFDAPAETPYIGLAIPVQYKLNSYNSLIESNYVPKYEQRLQKLRTGAEDELTHQTTARRTSIQTKTGGEKSNKTDPGKQANLEKSQTSKATSEPTTRIFDLVPGKHLTEPIEYPPMHIFVSLEINTRKKEDIFLNFFSFFFKNPAPGLMSYEKTLPYSGVDLNYHLNPLPRFERDQLYPTQKKFLDRDVINKI